MTRHATLIAFLLLTAACSGPTPDEVYQDYNAKLIEGLSFDAEKTWYSERKQQEVEEQVPVYMEQMGRDREGVIELYETFSQEQARCHAIELVEERVEGETAYLEYNQTDTCGEEPRAAGKQKIRMVTNADGDWKIDHVEVAL